MLSTVVPATEWPTRLDLRSFQNYPKTKTLQFLSLPTMRRSDSESSNEGSLNSEEEVPHCHGASRENTFA